MEGSYLKRLKSLSRVTVLILDDFGLQSLDKVERESLMDIIDDRYDRKSTIIASQIPISKWFEVIGEGTIADAILDRIVHSAYRIELMNDDLVSTHMAPVIQSVEPETPMMQAARVVCHEHIHRLVVIDDTKRPVGILSSLDFVAAMVAAIEE